MSELFMCDGSIFRMPMFDPLVAKHFAKESSLTGTLMAEVNQGKYAQFFEGKKDLLFLDIGANIGLVSIYASPACKRIVAVEPSPKVFPVLRSMTVGVKKIEPVPAALAPSDSGVDFYENDINSTASSTVNTYGKKTAVMGMRLSSMLRIYQLEHVDVCKIDAEGAEGDSLDIIELDMCSSIIKTYYIETHNCPKTTWNYKLGQLVQFFSQLGYHKMSVDGMALTATRP